MKSEGDGGEFTLGRKISILMRQNELNDQNIIDLHGKIYWEYSSEEGIDGIIKELKNTIKTSKNNDLSFWSSQL